MDRPLHSPLLEARLKLLAESHRRLSGKPMLSGLGLSGLNEALWVAPCVIVAHGDEADPVFFYGNRMALELFELDFAEFTRLPSRYSAEPAQREARKRLLDRVTRHGYVDDYTGVRITSSGRRFEIMRATVWNLIDEAGRNHGQAATFTDWRFI